MAKSIKKPKLSQRQRAFVMSHLERVKAIAKEQGTVITAKGQATARAAVERTLLSQNKTRGK